MDLHFEVVSVAIQKQPTVMVPGGLDLDADALQPGSSEHLVYVNSIRSYGSIGYYEAGAPGYLEAQTPRLREREDGEGMDGGGIH